MKEKEIVIGNPLGLHARPAARFVKLSQGFSSDIFLVKDGQKVNGKSILDVLMLAAEKGDRIKLIAEGTDEERAIEVLSEFLIRGEEV